MVDEAGRAVSMSDQYDDSRYDSPSPGIEHGRYYPDGILQPYPMDPGLRILLEHPITVQRGGIKYPSKGTTMARAKMTTAQELVLAEETRTLLDQKITELRAKAEKEKVPPAPRESHGEAFSVTVKFTVPGKGYRFLILKTERGYFTTGQEPKTGYFPSWAAFIRWLHGGDVAWHSAMVPLDVTHADRVLEPWSRDD